VHPEKVVKPRKATITIIIIFFIGFFWAKLIHYSNKKRLLSVFLYILFNSAKQLFQ
jgi:glycopeptide antibiotics resistance protein